MLNYKFVNSVIRYLVLFVICVLYIGIFTQAYALDLTKLKSSFLKGDYHTVIIEGEKMMAVTSSNTYGLDELYYILGLSYLKDGNALCASDIFEVILKEFKSSAFREQALLGLGDTYFTRDNCQKAEECYAKVSNDPNAKFRALAYYRLYKCALKSGDSRQAKVYLDSIKQDSPFNLEVQSDKDLAGSGEAYYTVQAGSFSSRDNARKLLRKLTQAGYPAYLEESDSAYRVRVGRMNSREEAQELENKLSKNGYSTKIFP